MADDLADAVTLSPEVRRLNWAATALARSLSALIHGVNLEETVRRVCEVIVEEPAYRLAWVGRIEDDSDKAVRYLAGAGSALAYLQGLKVGWSSERPEGLGPAGVAVRTGRSVLVQDVMSAPLLAPWRDRFGVHGIGCIAAIPVKAQGRVLAILLIYTAAIASFGPQELSLFEQLADELGYALQVDDTRRRMAEAEVARAASDRRYRHLFDAAGAGIVITRRDSTIIDANRSFCEMLREPFEDIVGTTALDVLSTDQQAAVGRLVRSLTPGDSFQTEVAIRRVDGTSVATEIICSLSVDDEVMILVNDITERKRAEVAEEVQRAADARYRELFDTAQIGIMIGHDLTGIADVNPSLCAMMRIPAEELIGRRLGEFLSEDQTASLFEALPKLEAGDCIEQEILLRRRDGSMIPLNLTIKQVASGYLMGLVEDLSERKRAEAAEVIQRAADAGYREIFESSPSGILIGHWVTGIRDANAALCRIWGYDREELIGRRAFDLLKPEQVALLAERLPLLKPDEDFRAEFDLRRKDGTEIPVEMTSRMTKRGHLMTIVRDITETKRAEAAEATRRAADARYRQLFECSPDGIVVANLRGGIIEVNPAWRQVMGYSAEEVVGRFEREFIAANKQHLIEEAERSLKVGRNFRGETTARRKDGSTFPVEYSVNWTPDGNLMTIARDISVRRQAEEGLRESKAQIERVSRFSTLGEMALTIAHEINQPLAAIQSSSDAAVRWLAKTPPNLAEVGRSLERTTRQTQRIKATINRIRGFVLKGESQMHPVDVNKVITDVLALVRAELRNAEVSLVKRLDPRLPLASGDEIQLQQVLVNLVLNAADSMRSAERRDGKLTLTTAVSGEDELTVSVEDTGDGLDAQAIEHCFEPFFTTKPDGAGLGLPLCRSIIQSHGGRIWAGSAPEGGAIFQFTLPTCPEVGQP